MPYTLLIKSSTLTTAPLEFWPSPDQIDRALQPISGVIGRPRIVRQPVGGRQVTYATILVSVADISARGLTAIREQVFQRLQSEAGLPSGYGTPAQRAELWSVETLPYDPARNGTEAWWRNGVAAQTQTRNAQPDARMLAENPIGPTIQPQSAPIPGPNFRAFELQETSVLTDNAPTYEDLVSLFEVPKPPGVIWLGNATRVTRVNVGLGRNITRAVRVAFFPDAATAGSQADIVRQALEDSVRGSRGSSYTFDNARVLTLDPRFGRPSFWTSGEANRSQTWQRFSTFGADENPYGPNDPAMRPTTMAEWTAGALQPVSSNLLWPLAIGAAVLGAFYFFGPVGRSLSTSYAEQIDAGTEERRSRRQTRRNPRKARRSRSRSGHRSSR